MSVASWLESLGLGQYAPAFDANAIDAEMLPELTADDLKEIGVAALAHRKKIIHAIEDLGGGSPPVRKPAAPLGMAQHSQQSNPRRREAERRQLTVMFVDLVGSTELSHGSTLRTCGLLLRRIQNAVAGEVVRYDGYVAKLMGDGVLAYFGWPQAHEDDAERAVRAGLAAASVTASLTTPDGESLCARIGIATGLVVVGDLIGEGAAQEEAVVGDTPNLAARLQALAEPGSVVVSHGNPTVGHWPIRDDQSRKAPAKRLYDARSCLANHRRSGRRGPVRGAAWSARPDCRPEKELVVLLERWHLSTSGAGQVVVLSGEAGIGKSRLVAALAERLSAESHVALRYFCSPYHTNSALHPLIVQLERAAGVVSDDNADARFDKLEAFLGRSGTGIGETLPLLATLLSIDAPGRYATSILPPLALRARTLTALARLVEASASSTPILVLVEDAHWLDPTTTRLARNDGRAARAPADPAGRYDAAGIRTKLEGACTCCLAVARTPGT